MTDAPPAAPSRRARLTVLGLLVLAAGAGLYLYLGGPGGPAAVDPPAPDLSHLDPAVRRVIEREQSAVRQSSTSGGAWGRLGMAFYAHVFATEALTCFEQAERIEPENPRWPYFRALVEINDDRAAGIPGLQRAVDLCRDDTDAPRLRLAELYLQLGRADEAREQFQALLRKYPTHPRAHLGLARLHFQSDEVAKSREHVRHALDSPTSRKAARTLSAEIYKREGDTKAGRAELARSIDLPDDAPWPDKYVAETGPFRVGEMAQVQGAGQLLDQNLVAEATRMLEALVRDYPRSAAGWTMLGWAHLTQGRLAEAEQSLRTAVGLDPERARAWMTLGVVHIKRGNRPAGMAALRKAIELRPSYLDAHFNLGLCLKEEGQHESAIAAFRDALHCQPLSAPAHAQLGDVLLKLARAEEAVDHLRQAVELNPDDKGARTLLDDARRKLPTKSEAPK